MQLLNLSRIWSDPLLFIKRLDDGNLEVKKIRAGKSIIINENFSLDKDLARMVAMVLDGSLAKFLNSIMFSQKKDPNKAYEFRKIIKNKFNLDAVITKREDNTYIVTFSSTTLCYFLHQYLDIHKSDEQAHIPFWIWNSSKEIKIEYLSYAFAMEGSVGDPLLRRKEIRFHSCDIQIIKDLQKLLKNDFNIKSRWYSYYITGYGFKYYLIITGWAELKKFCAIGFAIKGHNKRLFLHLKNRVPKSWEQTLLKIKLEPFTIKNLQSLHQNISYRAIHQRVTDLIKIGYVKRTEVGFILTKCGREKILALTGQVSMKKLRTISLENERMIFRYISEKGLTYRNEISRTLKIHPITVHDVIRRLIKNGKIESAFTDRFQRKFYKIKLNSGSSPEQQ